MSNPKKHKMKYAFIRSILNEKKIAEKTNEIIAGQWFDNNLQQEMKPPIDKVMEECKKITYPFAALLKYYALLKKGKNTQQILKDMIEAFKLFGSRIREVLTTNSGDINLCVFIAKTWTNIIEKLLDEASKSKDVTASMIAVKLQTELNSVFYEVFE